ncbi:hypothetical protein Tco_0955730 [Tanacetum coccineum]|uniref:Uncharacterized protein n=1 Tax=Tanacetum coccineum TaxID=301880 RepID=A0ABQ5E823_9ASTR
MSSPIRFKLPLSQWCLIIGWDGGRYRCNRMLSSMRASMVAAVGSCFMNSLRAYRAFSSKISEESSSLASLILRPHCWDPLQDPHPHPHRQSPALGEAYLIGDLRQTVILMMGLVLWVFLAQELIYLVHDHTQLNGSGTGQVDSDVQPLLGNLLVKGLHI